MSNKNIKEMSGTAGMVGYQLPIGIVKRKEKVDELLKNGSLNLIEVVYFLKNVNEQDVLNFEKHCVENNDVALCEMIKSKIVEKTLREFVKRKVKEVVRKLPGGAGFALYSPNQGKKKPSRKVATFTTKLAARNAELARFPPKDPAKLNRRRKELDKLKKDPKAIRDREKQARKEKPDAKYGKYINKSRKTRKEHLENLATKLAESLFREEKSPSDWEQYVASLSKQAVIADKNFQAHQKNILKKSEKAISNAVKIIKKEIEHNNFSLTDKGIKKDVEQELMYGEFVVGDNEGVSEVGPIYVFVKNGYPTIEFSDTAKASLTKLEPDRNKMLRTTLLSVQEDNLDTIQDVFVAVQKRDSYLSKLENSIDKQVSDMSALEITMLKNLLVKKYRKIS